MWINNDTWTTEQRLTVCIIILGGDLTGYICKNYSSNNHTSGKEFAISDQIGPNCVELVVRCHMIY